ncbi:T9SS type A sorting domain-containing protein [Pontibacter sp. KCTC 32443]|uniref:T9SS type A sorting domain-containing protein n=1 Tax=Pontibacter TaxID=323449 RepID=UPI00164E894D|nr:MULTISPECIES: putative Ig domain-containing protein [Pontibacter]MBC5774495.1 T9SS type A sorting domain-containing protein [Pontibacter sp. KCTC 32443]
MLAPLHPENAIRILKSLVRLVSSNHGAGKGFLIAILILTATVAQASHFRYGNVSWRWVSGNTVEFKISQSWRYTAFYAEQGQTVNPGDFNFGDGTVAAIPLQVTAINKADDWMYGEAIITKTYTSTGNYNAHFTGCCRVSYLKNNADGSWNIQTTVTIGNGNSAPVTTLPAIVNLPHNKPDATFQMPVTDPDSDALTFSLATQSEMGGGTNPEGLAVNATTGIISFSTAGKAPGDMYNAAITITDSRGAKVTTDFMISITEQSTPPAFDYSLTPANQTVFQVAPGQQVRFSVKAHDTDPEDKVTLQATGIPAGAALNPALPVTSNPVQSSFTWTPTAANLGTYVINFIAQDLKGVQTTSSVTIQVSYKPVFDVPPTPAANSYTFTSPGQSTNFTLQASDPDTNDKVKIIEITGLPAGIGNLPTEAANPVKTQLSWSPKTENWGINTVTVKARDTHNDEVSHSFKIVVNTPPVFISQAKQTPVAAGYDYTYEIIVQDDDLPYGDRLEIITDELPGWLILEDKGNGKAILRGTPQLKDVGEYTINMVAEDKWHHNGGLAEQQFILTVTDPRCGENSEKVLICHGGQSICVPASTVQEHLAHGCYIGSCNPTIPNETLTEDIRLIAYPNPFNKITTIEFSLPVAGKFKLELLDAKGFLVDGLLQSEGAKGQYFVYEAGGDKLRPGIYIIRLITATQVQHVKVVKQ